MPSKKLETLAIHGAEIEIKGTEDVIPPIHRSTIFRHRRKSGNRHIYTRHGNPNRDQLEKLLCSLEAGERHEPAGLQAMAFSSGMAAISAILQCLKPGATVAAPDDLYQGTTDLLNLYSDQGKMAVDYWDMTHPEKLFSDAEATQYDLIWLETPSNPMLQVTDISKISDWAERNSVTVVIDNTWPTPVNQNPLDFGAHIVVHSTTKYLGGHSDIIGGALVAKKSSEWAAKLRKKKQKAGAIPSAEDCWLLTRSIRTLPWRMRGHNENAKALANWLDRHPRVEKVCYPGLQDARGHDIAARQMKDFGGMISFQVKGSREQALEVEQAARLITPATSLGGVESTWEHRLSSEAEDSQTPDNLIRISVGLEHIEDIKADIQHCFDEVFGTE